MGMTGEGAGELGGDLSAVWMGWRSSVAQAGWPGALPGVACHLLANPTGGMKPRRQLEKESSCGLVVSLRPETTLCFSGRTRGPIRVMLPAGKAEGCVMVQPVFITPSLWLGCRGMWPWQNEALECLICHCLVSPYILMPTSRLRVPHLPTSSGDQPPRVSLFSAEFHSPELCWI